MKVCPQCRAHYPAHFYVCPQDGKALDSVSDFPAGTVIREKYEILQKLGQGGMGTVYKARHLVFNEICAVKIVSAELASNPDFLERFRTEAVIMRRLNHPNAVRVEDIDKTDDNRPFLVMEYVEGENLRELLARRGALPVPEALEIARQVCSALTAAHGLNVLHRDIKPDNILIVSLSAGTSLVKVADFGVAKIKESTLQYGLQKGVATRAGVVLGTPAYMSPEQALGKPGSQLDARTDLYSLGVVLYEMLTGAQPFTADTPMGIMLHHMQTVPKPPHELTPDQKIPTPVSALVMKALEKDPEDRFPSAEEFQKSIISAASLQPPVVPPPPATIAGKTTEVLTPPPAVSPRPGSKRPSPTKPTEPVPKRINPLLIAAVVGVMATAGILGWNYLGNTKPPDKSSQTPVTQPESAPPGPVDKTPGGQTQPAESGVPSQGPSEAERRARQQRQQRERQIADHLSRGNSALAQSDFATAIREYQATLNLDSSNQSARDGLSRARAARQNLIRTLTAQAEEAMKQGNYLAAIEKCQAALSLNPGNAGLQQSLQKALDARRAECEIIGCED